MAAINTANNSTADQQTNGKDTATITRPRFNIIELLEARKAENLKAHKAEQAIMRATRRIWKKHGKKCYLLELPIEIRYMIYKEIVNATLPVRNKKNKRHLVTATFESKGGWIFFEHDTIHSLAMTCGALWLDIQSFRPHKLDFRLKITAPKTFLKAKPEEAMVVPKVLRQVAGLHFMFSIGLLKHTDVWKKFFQLMNMGKELKAFSFEFTGYVYNPENGQGSNYQAQTAIFDGFLKEWVGLECPFQIKLHVGPLKYDASKYHKWITVEAQRLERVKKQLKQCDEEKMKEEIEQHDKEKLKDKLEQRDGEKMKEELEQRDEVASDKEEKQEIKAGEDKPLSMTPAAV